MKTNNNEPKIRSHVFPVFYCFPFSTGDREDSANWQVNQMNTKKNDENKKQNN